jgi:hypothetical protein
MRIEAEEARRRYQREYRRKWLQKPENKEKHMNSQRKWRAKNKERLKKNMENFYNRQAEENGQ